VIVSASGGQYLKPGSLEPGFFSQISFFASQLFFLQVSFFASAFFGRSNAAPIRRAGRHGSVIMIWLIALPDDKPSAQPWK
jgi:hypothetical protein